MSRKRIHGTQPDRGVTFCFLPVDRRTKNWPSATAFCRRYRHKSSRGRICLNCLMCARADQFYEPIIFLRPTRQKTFCRQIRTNIHRMGSRADFLLLAGQLRLDDQEVDPDRLREICKWAWEKTDWDVFPACANYDRNGYCTGHPITGKDRDHGHRAEA